MVDKRKRRPPAYLVYAADDIASSMYYPLLAGERGVFDSMLRSCWVDGAVPRDPRRLALVLRLQENEVRQFLTDGVLAHFTQDESDPGLLRSPELVRQMANINVIRAQQSQGSKEGARITNQWRRDQLKASQDKEFQARRRPAGQPASPELNRNEESGIEQKQSLGNGDSSLSQDKNEWLRGYTESEDASTKPPPRVRSRHSS